jgi:phage minor structural protein
MIAYYLKNETDFSHNGLGALDGYIINPVVTEELNGIFSLAFDYPIHAPHADGLLPERVVRCPVPEMDAQLFRIAEREAAISGLLHIVAHHVFYDLAQNLIEDTFVVNKNGQQALAQILGAAQFSHPFTGGSNIAAVSSARLVRKSVCAAILDDGLDNSFLSRWGGEVARDNFHIAMQSVRGSNNGVQIRDKKNLTGYRADIDFGTICTRIMPEGYDGLLLPEKYVDSPRLNDYNTPRIRVVKYDSVKAAAGDRANDEDTIPLPEAYDMLQTLAAKEFSENHIDLPQATYQIEFAPLERTEEYKEFAALETIGIGDTVTVIHEEDGLNITARMVSYTYDPLNGAYISITLGNYAPKFTDVAKELRRVDTTVRQAASEANYALQSANGKNSNYYGSVTPANPHKGDVWYKENGDKTEIWIYESRDGVTQWYPLSTDLTQEQIKQELAAAETEVAEAKTAAAGALAAGQAAQAAAAETAELLIDLETEVAEAKTAAAGALTAGQAAQAAASETAELLIGLEEGVTAAQEAAANAASAVSGYGSDISVLTDCITMITKGQTGLSLISIDPTTITIKANKVNIDGTTNISNGVIKTAHISDAAISTAKIADAAITNAKIANLDAAKINTGTLAADRIAAGSITSAKLIIANGFITNAMIADAAITNAKIANLDAAKINTGTLSADRIAAGSITSAKLTIASGFITNAMIADATIASAKIATLDAAKITTGTLSAARIAANSITADKLATNAIQVGLAGWTNSIRITPYQISWYSGDTLEGYIDSAGMNFYYGTRFIGMMGESYDASNTAKRGIATHLNGQGDYATWAYRTGTSGTYTRFLTFDPRNSLGNGAGIAFGTHLRLNGYNLYTSGGLGIYLCDNALTNVGTFPSWSHTGGKSRVTFGSTHLYFITNNTYYSCTSLMSRVGELISRVNSLISYFNNGWVKSITAGSNGSISWSYYSGTGLSTMSTTLS